MKKLLYLPYGGGLWFNIKLLLNLPLPLKNHFYKWHRLDISIGWYCTDCNHFFRINEKSKKLISEVNCSHCGSTNWRQSTKLAKAYIDKKDQKEIERIINEIDNKYF